MKIIISIICFAFFACITHAQQKAVPSKFVMTLQGGVQEGQLDKTVPQFQFLGGIQKNAWLVSLGAGMDYYGPKRSVPIFLDVKAFTGKKQDAFFGYGSLGYNASWLRDDEKTKVWWSELAHSEKGGIFYEAGAGYKITLAKKFAFGFSAGYSFKEQSEKIIVQPYCDFCFPRVPANEEPKPEIYKYQFRRISFKLHCWF